MEYLYECSREGKTSGWQMLDHPQPMTSSLTSVRLGAFLETDSTQTQALKAKMEKDRKLAIVTRQNENLKAAFHY
jgi:hypothetical protein